MSTTESLQVLKEDRQELRHCLREAWTEYLAGQLWALPHVGRLRVQLTEIERLIEEREASR